MTEPFKVPENILADTMYGQIVMADDVPRLCRSECEALLFALGTADEGRYHALLVAAGIRYLAERFPEAAPEACKHEWVEFGLGSDVYRCARCDKVLRPTPTAPTEPTDWVELPCRLCGKPSGAKASPTGLRDAGIAAGNVSALCLSCTGSEAPANDCKKGCTEHASCVAAARPEAGIPEGAAWLAPDGLKTRRDGQWVAACTACACERHQAMEVFLRLFIRDYLCQVDWPADLVRGADTIAAARKVAP